MAEQSTRSFRAKWHDSTQTQKGSVMQHDLLIEEEAVNIISRRRLFFGRSGCLSLILREGIADLILSCVCLTGGDTCIRRIPCCAGGMPRAWHARDRTHQAGIRPAAQPMARSQASLPRHASQWLFRACTSIRMQTLSFSRLIMTSGCLPASPDATQHEEECADFPAHHEPSLHSPGTRPREGARTIHLGHGR